MEVYLLNPFAPSISSVGKESTCSAGDLGLIPGLGRSPGEGKGYPPSILAWRIPWTVESMGLQRVRHTEGLSLSPIEPKNCLSPTQL